MSDQRSGSGHRILLAPRQVVACTELGRCRSGRLSSADHTKMDALNALAGEGRDSGPHAPVRPATSEVGAAIFASALLRRQSAKPL